MATEDNRPSIMGKTCIVLRYRFILSCKHGHRHNSFSVKGALRLKAGRSALSPPRPPTSRGRACRAWSRLSLSLLLDCVRVLLCAGRQDIHDLERTHTVFDDRTMRLTTASYSLLALSLALQSAAQQIFDVVRINLPLDFPRAESHSQWTTTEDKSQLLQYTKQSPPVNFTASSSFSSRAKSSSGVAAHITVEDSQVLQTIHGFGATLSSS